MSGALIVEGSISTNCKFCFIAGASKIVPIEAAPAEPSTQTVADAGSQEAAMKRGYQEYAIQQAAYEAPLKSNRFIFHDFSRFKMLPVDLQM